MHLKIGIPALLTSWHGHCKSSHSLPYKCRTVWSSCRPSDPANKHGFWVDLLAAITYIHHCHLLLLSPKTYIHLPSNEG